MLTPEISPGVLRRFSSAVIILRKYRAVEKYVLEPCMFSMVTEVEHQLFSHHEEEIFVCLCVHCVAYSGVK